MLVVLFSKLTFPSPCLSFFVIHFQTVGMCPSTWEKL